ncbi:hypothetical protein M3J09_002698 [Ascochyta lentis]
MVQAHVHYFAVWSAHSSARIHRYPRRHVLTNITPPRASPTVHLEDLSCDSKSKFVCFVDYTATSAHSVLTVRGNLETIWSRCKYEKCTYLYKIIVLVSCPPASPIQVRSHPAHTHTVTLSSLPQPHLLTRRC